MTKDELVTKVKQYLENEETSFVANIPTFIKLAEEQIYREVQLQDTMALSTNVATAGDRYLLVPDDFLAAYSLAVLDDGSYYTLLSKDVTFMREFSAEASDQDRPRFYSLYDDKNIILCPTPDQTYPLELFYFFKQVSLAEGIGTATTWLSSNGENALLYGTLIQAYAYMKGDQDVFEQYEKQYAGAIAALKMIAEGRNRKDSYRVSDRRQPA